MCTYFNPTYRNDIIYLWMFKVLKEVAFVLSDHKKTHSAVHAHTEIEDNNTGVFEGFWSDM